MPSHTERGHIACNKNSVFHKTRTACYLTICDTIMSSAAGWIVAMHHTLYYAICRRRFLVEVLMNLRERRGRYC